ncbi:erythromycin esterase family protein [Candidatus Gracilibacteria bacterium]|nr:erythromycin esterase family protein [Candidatus Gracilibacteria bacterium]
MPATVELLGFGEALHGGEEFLVLRNRLFRQLVTDHGYRALAIESSLPKAEAVNAYIAGHGASRYEDVADAGISHGFGQLTANRELVEWMRQYNCDPANATKLRFYGFDIPIGTIGAASPRQSFEHVLAFLAVIDERRSATHRQHIEPLLGEESAWDNPAMYSDRSLSLGGSQATGELRLAIEDLISELRIQGPGFGTGEHAAQYSEALHYAIMTRQLLNFHVAFARGAGQAELLGIRATLMADNLAFILEQERTAARYWRSPITATYSVAKRSSRSLGGRL